MFQHKHIFLCETGSVAKFGLIYSIK